MSNFYYDDSKVKAAIAGHKERLYEITMSCTKEEALDQLRMIWKAENKKQYKDLALMWACEEIAADLKGTKCEYKAKI